MNLRDRVFTILGQSWPETQLLELFREDSVTAHEETLYRIGRIGESSIDEFLMMLKGEEFADVLIYLWLRSLNHRPAEDLDSLTTSARLTASDPEPVVALVRSVALSEPGVSSERSIPELMLLLSSTSFSQCVRDQLFREIILRTLGWQLFRAGEFQESQGVFTEALEIANKWDLNPALASIGLCACHWRSGRPDEGLRVVSDSSLRTHLEQTGNVGMLISLRLAIARAGLVARKFATARHEVNKLNDLRSKYPDRVPPRFMAELLHVRGLLVFCDGGDLDLAEERVQEAYERFKAIGHEWGQADSLSSLVEIRMAMEGACPGILGASLHRVRRLCENNGFFDLLPRLELLEEALA